MRDHVPIEPAEFCELLTSHRRLERCNNWHQGVRGLRDVNTGTRYVTEANRLFANGCHLSSRLDDERNPMDPVFMKMKRSRDSNEGQKPHQQVDQRHEA